MFNWKLHCLWRYFTKKTGVRQDIYTSSKCFCTSPTLVCLLLNTISYNGFLQMETQHEVANDLFAKG